MQIKEILYFSQALDTDYKFFIISSALKKQTNLVGTGFFDSVAEFFCWTGPKVLPSFGNTAFGFSYLCSRFHLLMLTHSLWNPLKTFTSPPFVSHGIGYFVHDFHCSIKASAPL